MVVSHLCECRGLAGRDSECPFTEANRPELLAVTAQLERAIQATLEPKLLGVVATHLTACEIWLCEACLAIGRKTARCCGCGGRPHARRVTENSLA